VPVLQRVFREQEESLPPRPPSQPQPSTAQAPQAAPPALPKPGYAIREGVTVNTTGSVAGSTTQRQPPPQSSLTWVCTTIGGSVHCSPVWHTPQTQTNKPGAESTGVTAEVSAPPAKPGAPLLEGISSTAGSLGKNATTEVVTPTEPPLAITTVSQVVQRTPAGTPPAATLVGAPQTAGVTKTPAISPTRALLEGVAPTTRELLESATATSHAQPTPPTTSTPYGTGEVLETGFQPPAKPGQAKLEGIAPTAKALTGEVVSAGIVSQPTQQTQTQGASVVGVEELATPIAKPGAPLLEGVTPTVSGLRTTTPGGAGGGSTDGTKTSTGSPPTTTSGGVVIQHVPGGVVGHGGVKKPTTTGGGTTPPSGGTGTGGSVTGGGSTPSTDAAIQNTALSIAQGVISDYTKNYSNNPFIVDAKSSQDAINFLSYLNSLKQSNPTLYNQLMQNPTIQQAVKYANLIAGNYEAAGGYAPLTMTKQQFGLTTANNLIAQINQNMQSGNYKQALQYAQELKTLAQQYNLPISTQSLNTMINELTILSQLPQAPNTQSPKLSPQLMRALARSEPGFYNAMQNVYYQNAYQQWQSYANELNQLANQAQSMGLTDLASRLRAQASVANQMAQGYLGNYVLTSPNVQNFISTYNQYIQLLRNQPDPSKNPQAYLAWLSQVVAMSQQVGNTWQSVYPFLRQYQSIPQIQQLIQQGQYAQQLVQQVTQYARQLQANLLASPGILNATPQSLTQLGGLGGVLTGSALMQSLTQLPPGTQIQVPNTPPTTQQGQNAWWSPLANWFQSQLGLARQTATSKNPLLKALGYTYLGTLTLGSSALAGIENLAGSILGGIGEASVGLAEAPLIGASTITGPRSPLTQFLLGVGKPLAQTGEFLQSSAGWINQQNMQAWQGVAPQTTVAIPSWARWATPLIEAFYPYVKDNKLVVSPGTVIGAIGYNLPLVLSGVGAAGGAMKGVGLAEAGEETLASELTPELSTRLGMQLAERAPWLARTLPRLGLTSERLVSIGSTLERVGAVGNLIDPYAWMGRLTGELLAGTGELASRLGGRLERYALSGLAKTIPEGTPEFYMLPRYAQYGTALRNIGLNLLGAVGTTMERVGGLAQVIGRPLAEAFPMPWEYYTYRQLFGEVGPLGRAVMPYTRPLTQELRDLLTGARYTPFRYSFPLVIASTSGTPARLAEVLGEGAPGGARLGRTVLETGAGTITGIERYGYLIPIAYRLPGGETTGVALVARISEDGKYVELTVPVMGKGGLARMHMAVPVSQLDQAVKDIAQRLAIQLQLPPGGEVLYEIQPLYLFRIRTNAPGLPSELTAFLTPQQIRQYRSLVAASLATMPNELVEMLGLTASANQVEALRNAYYTLLASLLGQPPEAVERFGNQLLGLGSGLATQYMRGLSPTLVSDIMSRTGRTPASLFYEWFQNVMPYVERAQRSIITPGVGVFDITASTTPFGRVYMPYAFGMTEVPIGVRSLLETMPGSEIIGTGALLRTPESLVVPGLGGLRRVLGELVTLNVDPYTLARLLSRVENELVETGITARPLQEITEVGTPLYTHASAEASAEFMGGWGELLRTAPVSTARAEELGEITTGEHAPYLSRLRPGEAEAVAESEAAVRSVPTGAAGIKALPTTAEVEEVGAAPSLGKLLSEETEEGTAKYLSALTGLRLAEEAASSVTEAAPELLRVGVRAATNVSPTQPPTPSISMRSISTTTPITQLPTTLGISTKGVSAATPTVQPTQPPKVIETQLQPITVETQPVQAPRQQPIQPTSEVQPIPTSTPITKTTETEVSSVTQPPTPSISTRSVGISTPNIQPSPSIEEQLQPTQTPSPTPISTTASTKTTETEVLPTRVPIASLPTTPTTGSEAAEATGAVVRPTPRLQPPTTTTGGGETTAPTGTGAGVVAGVLLPTGLTTPPTTQTQQQQQQGQGVGEEVGVGGGEGVGEYLSTLAGLGLGGGARVGGVPVVPVVVGGGGATEEETASEETERLRGGRIPITPVGERILNEEPVLGVLPGNLREEAGDLLSFSWYGPGRINVSPPGVLELLRASAPPGQPTTRQYYTQVAPVTLAPVEIPPPPLPPVTIQEAPTTGQGVQSPPTAGAPAPPVPPTATPPPPPFLIPLLWFPSWMPQPQTTTGALARPGAMREILVL